MSGYERRSLAETNFAPSPVTTARRSGRYGELIPTQSWKRLDGGLTFFRPPLLGSGQINREQTRMVERNQTMEDRLRGNIRTILDAYSRFFAIGETVVARLLFGDGSYFLGIFQRRKSGSSFRVRTYDVTIARFSERWPAGLEWPAGIDRIDPADVPDMPPPPRRGEGGVDDDKEQPESAAA